MTIPRPNWLLIAGAHRGSTSTRRSAGSGDAVPGDADVGRAEDLPAPLVGHDHRQALVGVRSLASIQCRRGGDGRSCQPSPQPCGDDPQRLQRERGRQPPRLRECRSSSPTRVEQFLVARSGRVFGVHTPEKIPEGLSRGQPRRPNRRRRPPCFVALSRNNTMSLARSFQGTPCHARRDRRRRDPRLRDDLRPLRRHRPPRPGRRPRRPLGGGRPGPGRPKSPSTRRRSTAPRSDAPSRPPATPSPRPPPRLSSRSAFPRRRPDADPLGGVEPRRRRDALRQLRGAGRGGPGEGRRASARPGSTSPPSGRASWSTPPRVDEAALREAVAAAGYSVRRAELTTGEGAETLRRERAEQVAAWRQPARRRGRPDGPPDRARLRPDCTGLGHRTRRSAG